MLGNAENNSDAIARSVLAIMEKCTGMFGGPEFLLKVFSVY